MRGERQSELAKASQSTEGRTSDDPSADNFTIDKVPFLFLPLPLLTVTTCPAASCSSLTGMPMPLPPDMIRLRLREEGKSCSLLSLSLSFFERPRARRRNCFSLAPKKPLCLGLLFFCAFFFFTPLTERLTAAPPLLDANLSRTAAAAAAAVRWPLRLFLASFPRVAAWRARRRRRRRSLR